jgi:chromosome segregation ATPase
VRLYEATARPAAPPAAPEGSDVLRIVGQLKGQLLALETTKRALERELSTARRQSEQLAADNLALRRELDAAGAAQAEVARLREENTLIEEESVDILSRLEQLRTENEAQRELLATLSGERQAAMEEIDRLRAAGGESELLSIKAEFLEKERQSLAEENTQIGRECEGLKDEAGALRREAAALRKQLKEIKESLLLVRDSARSDYYNLA